MSRVAIDDAQWAAITKHLKLPDEARLGVETAIQAYRSERELWHRPPAAVSKRLDEVSVSALSVADLVDGLDQQERVEIVEAWPVGRRITAGNRIKTFAADAREFAAACAEASGQVSDMSRRRLLEYLIARLDGILREHAKSGVSRGKTAMSFLTTVCGIADGALGRGAIDEAIRRLQRSGEISKKSAAKSTAEIGR